MSEIKTNKRVTYTEKENEITTELYLYALETIEHLGGCTDECIDAVIDYILERTDKWIKMNPSDCKFAVYQFIYRKIKYPKETEVEVPISEVSYVHILSTGAELLWDAVGRLTEREQEIIFHKYVQDMTYAEIAKLLGLSSSRIQQIDHKALRRLRHPYLLSKFVDIRGLRQNKSGYHCVPMIMI